MTRRAVAVALTVFALTGCAAYPSGSELRRACTKHGGINGLNRWSAENKLRGSLFFCRDGSPHFGP